MRRQNQAGFTLVELMIVVAIIGVLGGIVSNTLSRQRENQSISAELRALRAAVERTRAMAILAGSRMGTTRMNYMGTCPAPPAVADLPAPQNNLVWMVINPGAGTWTFPDSLTYDAANDRLDVDCRTENLGTAYRQTTQGFLGQFVLPAATLTFAFTATGRLIVPGALPANNNIFVQFEHSTAPGGGVYGFRVLSSGITCDSSDAVGNDEPCAQDRG